MAEVSTMLMQQESGSSCLSAAKKHDADSEAIVEELCACLEDYLSEPSPKSNDARTNDPALQPLLNSNVLSYDNHIYENLEHLKQLPSLMETSTVTITPTTRPQSLCVSSTGTPTFVPPARGAVSNEDFYDNIPAEEAVKSTAPLKQYFASGSPLIDPKYHGSPVTRLDAKILSGDTEVFPYNPLQLAVMNRSKQFSALPFSRKPQETPSPSLNGEPISFVKTRRGNVIKVVGDRIQSNRGPHNAEISDSHRVLSYCDSMNYRPLSQPIFPSAGIASAELPIRNSGRYNPLPPHPLQVSQHQQQQQQQQQQYHYQVDNSSTQSPSTRSFQSSSGKNNLPTAPAANVPCAKPLLSLDWRQQFQQRFHLSQRNRRSRAMTEGNENPDLVLNAARFSHFPPSNCPEIAHTPWGPTPNVAVALDPTYRPQSMIHLSSSPIPMKDNNNPLTSSHYINEDNPVRNISSSIGPSMADSFYRHSVLQYERENSFPGVLPPTGRLVHSQSHGFASSKERKSFHSFGEQRKMKGVSNNYCGVQ